MEVSKLKSWVLAPSTESVPPNSRVNRRGPVTLLCPSCLAERNAPSEAMIADIRNTPSMTDVYWLARSNWPSEWRPTSQCRRALRAGVSSGVLMENLKASISSGDDDSNAWRIRSFHADRS